MAKRFLVIFLVFVLVGAGVVFCADPVTPKSHMAWEITGLSGGVESNVTCVNQPVVVKVVNKNVKRPLDHVLINVIYGTDRVVDLMTPSNTGAVQFVPNSTGVYTLMLQRQNYFTERVKVDVVACSVPASTTTTFTTSTTEEPTTTEPATTTTSTTVASTMSTVAETCSDGIRDQGEEGIDCGGPCRKCPSAGTDFVVVLAVAVVLLALAVLLLAGRGKKSSAKVELVSKEESNKHSKKNKQH